MSALRKHLESVLAYVLAAGLIGYAAVWAVQNWQRISRAFALSPGYLVALAPLAVGSCLLTGLINQLMATHLGARLRFRQWASLAFASALANYLLPMRAGTALRAGYFKRQCNLPVTKFAGATAAAYVMALWANSLVGLGALGWLWLREGIVSWPLLGVFLGAAALCTVLVAFSPRPHRVETKSRLRAAIARVHTGWDILRRSPVLLVEVAALALGITALHIVRLYLAFAAIGNPVSLAGCVLVAAVAAIAVFISVTPAGLGVREAAILVAAMVMGVTPEVSLLAAAAHRAVGMLVVLSIGPVATLILSREAQKASPPDD